MSERIFRQRALQQGAEDDEPGGMLQVAPPGLVRLFLLLGAILVLAVALSIAVRVKITARGRGVIRPEDGIVIVRSPATGHVRRVDATPGQWVGAGAMLVELDAPVFAPVDGIVDAIPVRADQLVTAGTQIGE